MAAVGNHRAKTSRERSEVRGSANALRASALENYGEESLVPVRPHLRTSSKAKTKIKHEGSKDSKERKACSIKKFAHESLELSRI